jgi:glycosyltransferase involved in cell wall biosynthesis
MLRGNIEVASPTRLAGWVQDSLRSDAALELLVINNGIEVGNVLADRHRPDLAKAGIGNGHHAFEFTFPPGTVCSELHIIRILEKSSGLEFPGSPIILKASQPFVRTTKAFLGSIDSVGPDKIAGWAWDQLHPQTALTLLIFDNEELIGRVIADLYREDLKIAGLGNGSHAFEFATSLDPSKKHSIRVKREGDGVAIPGSPFTLNAPKPEEAAPKHLTGSIDRCNSLRVSGWVRDSLQPDEALSLLVTKDNQLLGRLLANGYREDLQKAGIGDGRFAFDLNFAQPLTPTETHIIHVISEADGSEIPGSPVTLRASQSFDVEVQKSLEQALDQCGTEEDIPTKIAFLAGQIDKLLQRRADSESGRDDRERYRHLLQRWKSQPLRDEIAASDAAPGSALRALVIDDRLPKTDRDAGSVAILSHIRSLQRLGYRVSIAPATDFNPATADRLAIEALDISCCCEPYYGSVEEVLRRQAGEFDLVYLYRVSNAAKYGELVFNHFPRARRIYSVADLHHIRLLRQSEVEDRPELRALSKRIQLAEFAAAAFSNAVITHSKDETDLLKSRLPGAVVFTVPWSVKLQPTKVPFSERAGLAFIGGFSHAPNQDAAWWLIQEIMPLVRSRDPEIQCFLVGSDMPEQLKGLERDGIVSVGYVKDLAEIFDRVRLTVAPLAYGAGLKGKVIDSLSAGIPCVCTNIAAEGLNLPDPLRACIADDAAGFAASIVRLHSSELENEQSSRAGLEFIDAHFSDTCIDDLMREIADRTGRKLSG